MVWGTRHEVVIIRMTTQMPGSLAASFPLPGGQEVLLCVHCEPWTGLIEPAPPDSEHRRRAHPELGLRLAAASRSKTGYLTLCPGGLCPDGGRAFAGGVYSCSTTPRSWFRPGRRGAAGLGLCVTAAAR